MTALPAARRLALGATLSAHETPRSDSREAGSLADRGPHGGSALGGPYMVDREYVLAVLRRRFRAASVEQVAEAANAIMRLPDEWEEVSREHARARIESLSHSEFRVFVRRSDASPHRSLHSMNTLSPDVHASDLLEPHRWRHETGTRQGGVRGRNS